MTIEISKETRKDAIESIQQYFQEKMEEKIGNLAADALLDYFLEELGPIVYNKAVADVQDRLQARIMEVDIEIHEDEFQYWRKPDRQKKGKWASCNFRLPILILIMIEAWKMESDPIHYVNSEFGIRENMESDPIFCGTDSVCVNARRYLTPARLDISFAFS